MKKAEYLHTIDKIVIILTGQYIRVVFLIDFFIFHYSV